MQNIKNIVYAVFVGLLVVLTSCENKDYELGKLTAPTNVSVSYEILGQDESNPYGDGLGWVYFVPKADNVITFNFDFGDGTNNQIVASGDTLKKRFSKNGIVEYFVAVEAVGAGGLISIQTLSLEVFSQFDAPEEIQFLTGGSSKKWYWAADQAAHVGLGPNNPVNDNGQGNLGFAEWWQAAPYERTCMYESEFVFTKVGNNVTFEQTAGSASIPGTYAGKLGLDKSDTCFSTDVADPFGVKNVSFAPSNSLATDLYISEFGDDYNPVSFTLSDGGFMSWWVGTSTYEIKSIDNETMVLRIVEDETFAWYHIFTSVKPGTSEELDVKYTNLVWSDEFDNAGAPDAAKWTYDLGATGWGNQELQNYTNNAENVVVADGMLKITAKKAGAGYTSARVKTQGLYDFTYGRVDVKAKLPAGQGTWPAIWMLGSNFPTAGWPACGEIDIMEHVGKDPGVVHSSIHNNASSGATVNTDKMTVADATTEFHVYSVNWSPNQISFLIDDEIHYTYKPDVKDAATWPFDASQFIIMNIAMGGTWGGDVDPAFQEASMEIDYVRVYQE